MLGHERGAGRRAGHVHAVGVTASDQLCDGSAAQGRRQPQLVASRHKDAVTFLYVFNIDARLAVLTRDKRQYPRVLDTELAKQLFVVAAGVFQLRSGGNYGDPRLFTAADTDESIQDFRVVEFFLGAADGDDVAALAVVAAVCRTH